MASELESATRDETPVLRGPDDARPVPDYDGIEAPGPSPEEVLLWLPRALLSPLYFVSEHLIRRPLTALLSLAERESWPILLVRALTWDDLRAGIIPTAFYDFGFLPSFGLYFFWNDLGALGHRLRVQLGFGGVDYLRAIVRDRVVAGALELSFRAYATARPDGAFQGFGASSQPQSRARYRRAQVGADAQLAISPWRRSVVALSMGIEWNHFDPNGYEPTHHDPSVSAALASGALSALPVGFDGYLAYRQHLRLTLDSREPFPAEGHGVRLDGFVEQSVDLLAPVERRWIRWGLAAAAFVDLGEQRIVSLHVRAMFVDPLGAGGLPFTEHVVLGERILELPGFWRGSLVDRSASVLTLRYRWPVWVHLDASLFVATGNVFTDHLADFALERLRLGWGFALQTLGDGDYAFRIVLAWGTTTFDRGAGIESFRFGIGGDLDL